MSKVEKAKKLHQDRIDDLEKTELDHKTKAELIHFNLRDVDKAIEIIRSGIEAQMKWQELSQHVKEAKKMGDPVAGLIWKLNLEKKQMTLLLEAGNETDEEQVLPASRIDVDITISAAANARNYFDKKKIVHYKAEKTKSVADKVIKGVEEKSIKQLKDMKVKNQIQHIRKPYWFEKFHWFISSDNILVISGTDMQQNEVNISFSSKTNSVSHITKPSYDLDLIQKIPQERRYIHPC